MKVPKQREVSRQKVEASHSPIIAARSIMPYANRPETEWCEAECRRVYAGDPVELRRCLGECRGGVAFYRY